MSFKFLLVSFFLIPIFIGWQLTDKEEDQLILFVSKQNDNIDQAYLDAFTAFAKKNETHPKIQYIEDTGAPQGITVTPSIVYQNAKGHSVYYGRYRSFSRMKTFLRKSRLKHSKNKVTPQQNILVWEDQRATITAPLKITKITGKGATAVNAITFQETAKTCFDKGMKRFELLPTFDQPKSNRAFYVDIHPHVSEDNNLSLKAEIYSQFNCIRSVYHSMRDPLVSGKWKNRKKLLETAASLLESEIIKVMNDSKEGDDFVSIPTNTKAGTLQLDLVQSVVKRNNTPISEVVPQHWKVKQVANSRVPVGAFSFMSPLDGYAGEIEQMTGEMTLNEQKGLNRAMGAFSVAIEHITMGEVGFDHEVRHKMLKMDEFPKATFTFLNISDVSNQLTLYREEECAVQGTFNMKGTNIPITVPATIELRLDKEGRYLLHTVAVFSLNLFEDFSVKGPDGPSPARDVLEFVLKFDMEEG